MILLSPVRYESNSLPKLVLVNRFYLSSPRFAAVPWGDYLRSPESNSIIEMFHYTETQLVQSTDGSTLTSMIIFAD